MVRLSSSWRRRGSLLRWLTFPLGAGLVGGVIGCASPSGSVVEATIAPPAPAAPEVAPAVRAKSDVVVDIAPGISTPAKALPISLDTVLHLGEAQNPLIALARERLHQSYLEKALHENNVLPDIYIGTAYFRHEGGIQNEDGTLTHSSFGNLLAGAEIVGRLDAREALFRRLNDQRSILQDKAQLKQVSYEQLLDALDTYVDMLTVYTGQIVAVELEQYLNELLKTVKSQSEVLPGYNLIVKAIEASLLDLQRVTMQARQQQEAAGAKLAYLLNLGACAHLIPADPYLIPVELVDADVPCCDLVAHAWANGPGVVELQQLLTLIRNTMEEARGISAVLPTVEMRMLESAYGAGPGGSLDFDNRWDLGIQVRWNLNDFLSARDRIKIAQSRFCQVELTYQDVRGKLAAGVQEAQDAIQSGRAQIAVADERIKLSREAYQMSRDRWRDTIGSPLDVLQALGSLQSAQLNKLQIIRDYNKAQVRLLLLLGPTGCGSH